ncbi:protein-tyrosine-phosphatase [Maribacter sp. 4U21]|uniref:arsenate-mycothiol transferase ArsC n=1 Tax=Maribacter sp. 4U21 TaxID=1889779 RepID=UPI000C15CFC6|nr:protein-tyrosine-phosphatase [Maribacter sp. 4U21]PIB27706.1 protein-tyrosine-phosphatase [Maribacter sp. 4U21]
MQQKGTVLFEELRKIISKLDVSTISEERRAILQVLVGFIQEKKDLRKPINLNFVCTHNSRRSHMAQIWAQVMAYYFNLEQVYCYSGGAEATALFPKVAEVLRKSGFEIVGLSTGANPVYSIKYAADAHPIIGFSKTYDHPFNPKSNFAAVMTCSHADENCPFIPGAEKRIALTFEDPKEFDNTPLQTEKYQERSNEIATELLYVFSKIK